MNSRKIGPIKNGNMIVSYKLVHKLVRMLLESRRIAQLSATYIGIQNNKATHKGVRTTEISKRPEMIGIKI